MSDAGSAVSTATFLGSHVDHVYGHAAAREIPLGFAKETVQSGCRLLTRTASLLLVCLFLLVAAFGVAPSCPKG